MKYAYYNSSDEQPAPVMGWLDDEVIGTVLPDSAELFELTDEQWDVRMQHPWAILGMTLVPYTPPPPKLSLQQQAQQALNNPVIITSTTNADLNGTYNNNEQVRAALMTVASQLNAGMGFPTEPFYWSDVHNYPHEFTEIEFKAFTNAISNFTYANQQVLLGVSTTLPSNELNIDTLLVKYGG